MESKGIVVASLVVWIPCRWNNHRYSLSSARVIMSAVKARERGGGERDSEIDSEQGPAPTEMKAEKG